MPQSKLRAYGLGLAEATLLTAALTVPLLVNHYGHRIADLPKGALLLGLALVGGLGAAIVRLEEGRAFGSAWRRSPLALGAAVLALAAILATILADQPRQAFLGGGERAMGLVGILTGLAVFAIARVVGREGARAERLAVALCAGSLPVAAFAVTQALGLEALPGRVESASRVFGSLGNPIFLAAYLMLVAPLTLWRIGRARARGAGGVAVGWALALALQLGAMALSQSRGPILGLAAGLVVWALASGLRSGRRGRAWAALAVAAAGLAFISVLNLPGGPLSGLRGMPLVGRFGEISAVDRDSSSARLRIWRSARRLLAAEPGALAHGHGPESFTHAILPYGETYMGGVGQGDRLVDRGHNVLYDALIMTGLPGALGLLLVYGAWLWSAAALSGLAPDAHSRRGLALALAAGTGVGALSWLAPQPLAAPGVYAGALTLLGLPAGLAAWLVARLLRSGGAAAQAYDGDDTPTSGLALALLAVGAAAVVEASFGIRTVVTEMVFWALAGLLAARHLAAWEPAEDPGRAPARSRAAERPGLAGPDAPVTIRLAAEPEGLAFGMAGGAALSVLLYTFLLYRVTATAETWAIVLAVGLAILAGQALAAADLGIGAVPAVGLAIAVGLAFALLRFLVLALASDPSFLWLALALWVLALAALAAPWLSPPDPGPLSRLGPGGMILYPLLLVPAMAILFGAGLMRVRSDIYFQSALANFDAALAAGSDQARVDQLFQSASSLYDRAVALNRYDDAYPLAFGERFLNLGTAAAGNLEAAAAAFSRAQALVAEAEALNPLMPYHKVNRGRLQLLFSQMLQGSNPQQAQAAAANAEIALEEAFKVVPYDPAVVNELAMAKIMQGIPEKAQEARPLLELSRGTLDPNNAATHRLLGQLYRELDLPDESLAAFQKAESMLRPGHPDRGGILVSLGELARERGDLPEGERLYREALVGGSQDWRILFNFGLILRQNGKLDEAAAALQTALQLAPAEAQGQIQGALEGVMEQISGSAAPAGEAPPPGAPPTP